MCVGIVDMSIGFRKVVHFDPGNGGGGWPIKTTRKGNTIFDMIGQIGGKLYRTVLAAPVIVCDHPFFFFSFFLLLFFYF